jgi:cyclophilin family peptidyl-prolyl cis-trans isomerase
MLSLCTPSNPDFEPMNIASRHPRVLPLAAAVSATALLLSACGGGGDSSADGSSVSTASVSLPAYSQKLTLTVNGTNADKLVVTATGCKDVALSNSGALVSSALIAYYQCTVSAVGAGQLVVKRPSDGAALTTVPFNVPMPQVTMNFSNGAGVSGNVVVTLAPDKTPITVDNFLKYVNSGFYKDTRIHRVAPGFIIQGGAYGDAIAGNAASSTVPLAKPTAANIVLEVNKGLSNKQWTIAMARTSSPDTANSQFYFNLVDNLALDSSAASAGYAVFGSITAGTSNVAAIANPALAPCVAVRSLTASPECTPIPNVVLTSATQTQ